MRDSVLWRKISRIILMISSKYSIPAEQALDAFYKSRTYAMLADARYGLQLMSDEYILDEYSREM